ATVAASMSTPASRYLTARRESPPAPCVSGSDLRTIALDLLTTTDPVLSPRDRTDAFRYPAIPSITEGSEPPERGKRPQWGFSYQTPTDQISGRGLRQRGPDRRPGTAALHRQVGRERTQSKLRQRSPHRRAPLVVGGVFDAAESVESLDEIGTIVGDGQRDRKEPRLSFEEGFDFAEQVVETEPLARRDRDDVGGQ